MWRKGAFLLLAALVLLGCSMSGCGRRGKAWYRTFAAPFEAEVHGKMNGISFEAHFCRGENGTTVTFYAPATLANTTLTRDADGQVTVTAGDVTAKATGFEDLFLLFPLRDESRRATVTREGHTLIEGDGFMAEFLPSGAPYRLRRGEVTATVVRFVSLDKVG